MSLQELKQLRGKTIKKADLCWGAYGDCDNRSLTLEFTDGTTFDLEIRAYCSAEAATTKKADHKTVKEMLKDRKTIPLESDGA